MDDIRRADSFIDALAGGRPVAPQDAADAELAALLGNWRDEMRWPPATELITEAEARAALNAGRTGKRPGRARWDVENETTPRRRPRGLSVIGSAAAAVLCIGGFGAVVAGAGPGDSLYGLRTMLFGTPKEVRDDQVALAAQTQLNQVQDLIAQGNWDQAQDKLVAVSSQVASIGDQQQKQDLLDQFNNLSAKVVERDPAATVPPGIVYTVPPSAAELVPAVAPSTTPSESTTPTSPTTSTSPATSETSGSTSTTTSAGASTSGSDSASSSSPPPSESTPTSSSPSSSAAPAATSASPTAQSQQTTTPTSAAPVTSTAAPAQATAETEATSAAPTTAVPSTTAPPAASAESTAEITTTAPVEKSASPTAQPTTAAPTEDATTAEPQPEAEVETTEVPQPEVTTTVVIPEPAG